MPDPTMAVQGRRVRRLLVTIPANAGAAVTLRSLVETELALTNDVGNIIGGKVWPASAAYHAGDSASSLPIAVALNTTYTEPCTKFLELTYVKADAGAIASVPVSIYLIGG